MMRPSVNGLNDMIGKEHKVLDDGFVRVMDYMGDDSAIVQAARVSYGEGTKKISTDRALIRYLMRHRHTTPFEMCEIKLHVRVPMDCWRQWIRHRSASTNEYSTRYSVAIDSAQRTPYDGWRSQAKDNKQGSGKYLDSKIGRELSLAEAKLHKEARDAYENRLELGVAKEQARKDLSLSTYTEAYWKIDLHNLLHFLSLRMDDHAQLEIRKYAEMIGNQIASKWCPFVWEAFLDYRLGSMTLSRQEVEMLATRLNDDEHSAKQHALENGWLNTKADGSLKPNRERSEFIEKLKRLGEEDWDWTLM